MRALAVLLASCLVIGCLPDPDVRITGGRKPAVKELPPIPDGPGAPRLAAGYRAYDVGDYPRALQDFQAAADAGMADAQYFVGLMHAEGEGTARSYTEAAKWYEKAAAQDQPDALFALAKLYVIGGGVARDSAKAIELYERAAKAYPPGEQRDAVEEQRAALVAVLNEPKTATNEPVKAGASEPAKTSP
jgi:TPR repeat protein